MYSKNLQKKIIEYYTSYYKSCGLKDFEERAKARLREEDLELERMKKLEKILHKNFTKKKHFIFGAGTAGLAVVLKEQYDADVYGIEPSTEEFNIIQMKLKERGIALSNFRKEYGEKLSFFNEQFDFVHCFTVLEHVTNVRKCIEEMVRITKKGGIIYINTPNYAFPEERHYKIRFPFPPAYMPRIFSYFYLMLRQRPYKFLRSINFLTERKLEKYLKEVKGIQWERIGKKHNQEIIIEKL